MTDILVRAFAILGASGALTWLFSTAGGLDHSRSRLFFFVFVLGGCFFWLLDWLNVVLQLQPLGYSFGMVFFLWLMLFNCLLAVVGRIVASFWKRPVTSETFVIFLMFTLFVWVVGAMLFYRAPA